MPTRRPRARMTDVDLDDRAALAGRDPSHMMDFAIAFPEQVREAADIGRRFSPPPTFRAPRLVVLSGMGGSAVAGDFLARLCEERSDVPFLVNRNYTVPKYVSQGTLFIASSHSGNTEETLAATAAALRRGASILCITTGGKLADFAARRRDRDVALLRIPQTDPPMPPRAALAYSFIPLVQTLETLGLLRGAARWVSESAALLERLRDQVHPDVPERRNRAKALARSLQGRIPWVHGTAGVLSAAAYRWRTQFNENSKMLAYSHEYPELDHNEVIGWERAEGMGDLLAAVLLSSPGDHWRVRARVDITGREFLAPRAPVHAVEAEGRSSLARLLWTVYLGDFVSLYLAALNQVDPGSIESINTLKRNLARLRPPQQR